LARRKSPGASLLFIGQRLLEKLDCLAELARLSPALSSEFPVFFAFESRVQFPSHIYYGWATLLFHARNRTPAL
jgi:hypothetical protein